METQEQRLQPLIQPLLLPMMLSVISYFAMYVVWSHNHMQAGAIRCDVWADLHNIGTVLRNQPLPKGRRVAGRAVM